jgi:threonine/homoserine/homoserine lactone efflux protein
MITQLLAGFVLGWVGSMPIAGAVSIFVFHRGLSGRMKAGLSLSAGAALAEAGWCLLAMLGANQIMSRWPAAEGIAKIAGAIILLVLGLYFLGRKTSVPTTEEEAPHQEKPLREFWIGFSLVAGNISVPLNWLALLTIAVGLGFHPEAASPLLFVLGVALGITAWFALLLKILSTYRTRLGPQKTQWIMRSMGLLLILTAVVTTLR